jgi:hypothetical protein
MPKVITAFNIRRQVDTGFGERAFARPQLLFFHSLGRETFWFPYAPREVSYSQLAAQYNEIRRPGAFPIIERSAPQLMQVSMEFRVADPKSNGTLPIENRLDQLRTMALWPGFILVTNMDSFLSRPAFPTQTWAGAKFAKFLMTDLTIDIVHRDLNNYATQADIRLTLTEDRNPFVFSTVLPRITYEEDPERVSAAAAAAAAAAGGGGGAGPSGGRPPLTDSFAYI